VSKPLTALGLMSGTSMDGIDVALLETDGETVTRREPGMTFAYDETKRELLRRALADAVDMQDRKARPGVLQHAEKALTDWHITAVETYLQKLGLSSSNIDVIGFHGQTVIHRPEQALTVQLGLGGELAKAIGVPVVYDMRAKDMHLGGQGAPLVPAYHRALVSTLQQRPLAVLNIGGVANVTYIGAEGELVAFDTGPGNALIDDWIKRHTGASRDQDGSLGLVGRVDEGRVDAFLANPFFKTRAPKSLDRNTFSQFTPTGLSIADGAATLAALTSRAIATSVEHMPQAPKSWIVCGGGRYNKAIMRGLDQLLPNVQSAEDLQLDGDFIEAEAWAFLAVRCLRGLPITFPGTTGVITPATGGVIARP
jgi:anhydro-N-acetylmuramic acid kinase